MSEEYRIDSVGRVGQGQSERDERREEKEGERRTDRQTMEKPKEQPDERRTDFDGARTAAELQITT